MEFFSVRLLRFKVNMNRVIFVCLALCLLIAPALCKPADNQSEKQIEDFEGETPIKNPDENEVNGTVNRNVERVGSPEIQKETDSGDDMEDDDKTDIATSSVNGQIQGVIELHGFNGECKFLFVHSTDFYSYYKFIIR